MPNTETWTIGRLLEWTTDYLKQHGADSPRLDAEVLLAEARGCQRIELYTAFDELATEQTRVAFRELVRRRSEGIPVAYLVGRREFYSMSFYVTPDVLIPRPETEFVVVALLDLVKQRPPGDAEALRIADVGTGSGVLAVCAARHVPGCHVTATDISAAALEVAQRNVRKHGVHNQIELLESDLLASVPEDGKFDFILSNPPYVTSTEMGELERDVRDHEPSAALVAGPKGTEVIERLVPQAASRLSTGGWLIMEISPQLESETAAIIEASGQLEPGPMIKDLAGMPRVVQAQRR